MSALPSKPNLSHLKKQAKDLLKSFQAGDAAIGFHSVGAYRIWCHKRGLDKYHRDNFFKEHYYFAELTAKIPDQGDRVRRYMEESTVVDGVEVRVVELTGEPGDAIFTNGSLIGYTSRNVSDQPAFVRG